MKLFTRYKLNFHFSLNFFSFFLLVTFIPDFVGIPPDFVKYPFWALKAALAFWVIFHFPKKIYQMNNAEQLFSFVALVYLLNMFIDIFMQKTPMGMGSTFDLISFCVSLLIAFSFRYDPAFYSNKSFYVFVFSLALGLLIAFFMAQPSPPPLKNRFDANSTVNSINYGQMGCALCIMAWYGFLHKHFKWSKVVYVVLFCLGALSIMKAGSRSPIAVLILVSAVYVFARWGLLKGLMLSIAISIVVWLSLDFLIDVGQSVDSGLTERIISAVENKETSGRDQIYANALNIFKESPVFGDFYLISSGSGRNGYAHNFFLEALLTTGLLGGVPFIIMTGIAFFKGFKLLQQQHTSGGIILLFLQLLVYGMFSSALYSSQDYWALCFFMLSMTVKRKTVPKPLRKLKPIDLGLFKI